MLKKIIYFGFSAVVCISGCAHELPVVGIWEKVPVSDGVGKLVARTSYVFTNIKLSVPTIFSGLRDMGAGMNVLCCIEVKNITPLNVNQIVKKYDVDKEFGEQMKSVKGLPFMYEAVPVSQNKWNQYFQTVMSTDKAPSDTSPYSAAVISLPLDNKKVLESPFRSGAYTISIAVKYPKNKNIVVYDTKINAEKITFSANAEPH